MISDTQEFGLTALQSLLMGESPISAAVSDGNVPQDPILGRIHQILLARTRGVDTGHADFAALLRHVLMARSSGKRREQLRIRKGDGWPCAAAWRRFGIHAVDLGSDLLLEAQPWRPEWLGSGSLPGDDVFADVFAGRFVRQLAETPIDPCVKEVSGYTAYVSPGQREAVRSLLHMPSGSTLVVNLPTGSGKTLVALLPVLLRGFTNGLTLFVVPTTALALDQARRMRDLLMSDDIPDLAWHANLNPEAKVAVKQRIRTGTQGILFASPEAATGALLPSLYDAAGKGSLRYLVIDEAHMVTEWGDGFRPAFQLLAGIRRGLLQHCQGEPLRTVLMSATIGPRVLGTLEQIFGPPETVQMVAAVHLRPEPRYWSYRAAGWHEKVERVLEIVNHAPRPFLLYVTEPREAEEWFEILKRVGYVRIACFHGNTPGDPREQIIEKWAADRLDGVVATSAFGVGMDKSDVRTIIHAVVPETLDRFYQEVGRGGRDGRASISVVIFTERDANFSRSLGKPRLIGNDNAFDRWKTMFGTRRPVADTELIAVDITAPPPHLRQQSDYTTAWNMRTLILLARSGLIALDSSPPVLPERLPEETDAAYEARLDANWEAFYTTATLRTLDSAHLNREHFDARTASDRDCRSRAAERTFGDLMAALDGTKEMATVLADLYRSDVPDRTVIVSKACRGCPHDPSAAMLSYQIPSGNGIDWVAPTDLSVWAERFSWLSGTVTILYPREAEDLSARLERAMQALVGVFGLAEVSAPAEAWREAPWMKRLHHAAQTRTLIARYIEEDLNQSAGLPIPRASLLWPWGDQPIPNAVLLLDRPLHVILAPHDVRGDHPLRFYADTASNMMHLDAFMATATL